VVKKMTVLFTTRKVITIQRAARKMLKNKKRREKEVKEMGTENGRVHSASYLVKEHDVLDNV
jgi:hypothetical protein